MTEVTQSYTNFGQFPTPIHGVTCSQMDADAQYQDKCPRALHCSC